MLLPFVSSNISTNKSSPSSTPYFQKTGHHYLKPSNHPDMHILKVFGVMIALGPLLATTAATPIPVANAFLTVNPLEPREELADHTAIVSVYTGRFPRRRFLQLDGYWGRQSYLP